MISLAFHAAAFFIAGLFVVFTVVNKSEPEFKPPPPVERPKMKLKKPKVKVRKSSQPKPSSRIVAKVKTREMPEIQLPDLMGTGEGLMGGTGLGGGDFMDLPEISEITPFGTEESIGNDLIGTFYDLKRTRSGGMTAAGSSPSSETIVPIFRDFLDSGWNRSSLARYYRSPRKLYTSTVIIPETPSVTGPLAFGESEKVGGYAWAVLYEGFLVHHEDIRFRFWGFGDNYLFAGIDGETVLAHSLGENQYLADYYVRDAPSGTPMTYGYGWDGKWIELKAGVPRRLQVLVAETDGGASSFMLCVEVDGEKYPRNPYRGGMTLPIFQMAVQSRTQVEELERVIYPGDASVNEGPIFQDFAPSASSVADAQPAASVEQPKSVDPRRAWTVLDGRSIRAELYSTMGDQAWLRTEDGRELKIPFDQFVEEDREYLALSRVPKFRIDFTESTKSIPLPDAGPDRTGSDRPVEITDYNFKVRVKLMDTTRYTYPLTVEYFAIGGEVEGDHYVLWQRGGETFTPSKQNGFSTEFSGTPIRRITAAMRNGNRVRGEKYDGYLVTVTDQRGEIIAYRASNEFLYRHLDRLKTIPVTRHFNKECVRVAPPRPIDGDRAWADSVFENTL